MNQRLKTFEVYLGDRRQPVYIEAWTKADAIYAVNELYPRSAFTEHSIFECPEWN